MSKKKKKIILIGSVVLAVLLTGILAAVIISGQKKESEDQEVWTDESGQSTGKTVVWNGRTYLYNEHLSNFLFLGIDEREPVETEVGRADAGQADAVFLISWDRVTGDMTVISIPRDTMTEIEIFDPAGESLGKSRDHISLAYAYGDGKRKSLELAEDAVSNLLYGIPIQGSCALNMDGIPALAESVGGVTVTVPNDSLEQAYPQFAKGAKVVLDQSNAEIFVRYRDVEQSQSALLRQERQEAFLQGFAEAMKLKGGDSEFLMQTYSDLEPYMVSSIGKDQFVKIAESAASDRTVQKWMIPGTGTQGEAFDEYQADDSALYEKIIETFYRPEGDS